MKLIEKHKRWMDKGELDKNGLCNSLNGTKYQYYLDLLSPIFINEPMGGDEIYWGYEGPGVKISCELYDLQHKYTPLRQTIVLLICAMHNEL